jgi:hypothetical protein
MRRPIPRRHVPLAELPRQRLFIALEHFFPVDTVRGVAPVFAAAVAFVCVKLPFARSYHTLRGLPLFVGPGAFAFAWSLRLWTNETLHAGEPRRNRVGLGIPGRQR